MRAEAVESPTQRAEGRKRPPHYAAVVLALGQVVVREVRGENGQVYAFHRLRLPDGASFPLPRVHRGRPLSELIGERLLVRYWPRTDTRGLLVKKPLLGRLRPAGNEALERPLFWAQGRVAFVDREEGRFGLLVRPNPGGRLKEAFTLVLWAPLVLLEGLSVGSGIYAEGEVRLATRRLVVRRVEPVRLWDDLS
ncbi:hypothetical protein [Thermus islandicus]|uniref:hypothetical protein n=1 Tax=Thermus islandicus TaxID=540988 RepID=UPI0003B3AE1B|nr:hypothetical protein [Thermus islandicus]